MEKNEVQHTSPREGVKGDSSKMPTPEDARTMVDSASARAEKYRYPDIVGGEKVIREGFEEGAKFSVKNAQLYADNGDPLQVHRGEVEIFGRGRFRERNGTTFTKVLLPGSQDETAWIKETDLGIYHI